MKKSECLLCKGKYQLYENVHNEKIFTFNQTTSLPAGCENSQKFRFLKVHPLNCFDYRVFQGLQTRVSPLKSVFAIIELY